MDLPAALTHMLTDSEIVVTAWSADADELVIRVVKDAANETGRLSFRGVNHVNLPPTLTVESIESHDPSALPADFWNEGTPRRSELGESEVVFLFYGAWGGRYFVVAESVAYSLIQ